MTSYTRQNAWNSGGTFDNPDLSWYAKGVGVMMSRALDDPNSWWFFAAIHGYDFKDSQFPGWGGISAPPQVPTSPLPPQNMIDLYWDQCQHGSWFFAPWHRGYLLSLEEQIRAIVVNLNGPSAWALPYWDYFGPNEQYKIPPAFTLPTLPDGSQNPLFIKARYGPKFDGDIYVTTDENSDCQKDTVYLDSYGGPETGFWHPGGNFGDLESNPHNGVHTDVRGWLSGLKHGLMADPDIAALDPIFYLHHCNIDRMWASWNANGNSNPDSPNWLNGPPSVGERKFAMPLPDGSSWTYTPSMLDSLDKLNYIYEEQLMGTSVAPLDKLNQRLMKLGAAPAALPKENMNIKANSELVGANESALQITSSGARATVKLDSVPQSKMSSSLAMASEINIPDQVYLRLENVRGNMDAFKLKVSVNQRKAGTASLFGLRKASLEDGGHGGEGLTFTFDISSIIDNLFLENALDTNSLDVRIEPNHAVPEGAELTVGRVSIYRQGQQ